MRIIDTALPVFCVCVAVMPVIADEGNAKKPVVIQQQTVLEISHDTTRITEPLDKFGFVDYVKAMNLRRSKGATPENNFENVIRAVIGPDEIVESIREEYHEVIGMDVPKGPFMKSYLQFARDGNRMETFDHVLENAWDENDYPKVAAWLDSEREHLDAIVQGSKRTHYYTPYIPSNLDDDADMPRVIAILLPSVQSLRQFTRSLTIRANHHIANRDLDAAWEDIHSIFRISRLTGQGMTLVEPLVGMACDQIAFNATLRILRSPALTDAQVQRILADVQALGYFPSMSEKIDFGERWAGLDALQTVVRRGSFFKAMEMIKGLGGGPNLMGANGTTLVIQNKNADGKPAEQAKKDNEPAVNPVLGPLVDWNVTAKYLNDWYDRLVEAAAETDFEKRRALFAKINEDMEQVRIDGKSSFKAMLLMFAGKPKEEMGRLIGKTLVGLLLPAVQAVCIAESAAAQRFDVLRFAVAAEDFRRNTGGYPRALNELLPKYGQSIPADRFTGKPLVYRPTRNGFVLYSVGRNHKDDLGRGYTDRGDRENVGWDDIVIRLKGS